MTVIPGNKIRGGITAAQLFSGNAQFAVGGRAHSIDDGVIKAMQLFTRHIGAKVDVPEKADARVRGNLFVNFSNRLYLFVVGRYAVPYQSERGWQAVKNINRHLEILLSDECRRRVECRGSRADDSHAEGSFTRPKFLFHQNSPKVRVRFSAALTAQAKGGFYRFSPPALKKSNRTGGSRETFTQLYAILE